MANSFVAPSISHSFMKHTDGTHFLPQRRPCMQQSKQSCLTRPLAPREIKSNNLTTNSSNSSPTNTEPSSLSREKSNCPETFTKFWPLLLSSGEDSPSQSFPTVMGYSLDASISPKPAPEPATECLCMHFSRKFQAALSPYCDLWFLARISCLLNLSNA